MKEQIELKLKQELKVESLVIVDESHKHAGHASAPEGGESHFLVKIVSPDFIGKSKVMRHKMVYKALEQELKEKIHALAIKANAPGE